MTSSATKKPIVATKHEEVKAVETPTKIIYFDDKNYKDNNTITSSDYKYATIKAYHIVPDDNSKATRIKIRNGYNTIHTILLENTGVSYQGLSVPYKVDGNTHGFQITLLDQDDKEFIPKSIYLEIYFYS